MSIECLWPFRAYRDASRGSMLERAAAYRHNRRLSRDLPPYLRRWSAISSALLAAAVLAPRLLSVLMALAFVISLSVTLQLGRIYLLFRRGHTPEDGNPRRRGW